jgi:hypothetical protein
MSTAPSRKRFHPAFLGPDSHRLFYLANKNLSVTDLSGPGGSQDCFDHPLGAIVRNHDLKFHFRQEIDGIFGAAINFAVTFLPAEPFYLAQRHPFHAHFCERILYGLGLEGFDDRLDLFHRAKLEAVRENVNR